MREEILNRLRRLSPEEERLLRGEEVRREDYGRTEGDFCVESGQLMPSGEMISLRPHTRFAAFPRHRHNYVEMMYMVAGETRHLINDREQVTLHAGELLMMNQRATHAIERAEEGDLAVNIMVQPAFFQEMLAAVGEDNPLGRFLVGSLTDRPEALSSLVFHVAQDVPVQCVLESMVATLTAGGAPLRVNPGGHDAAVPAPAQPSGNPGGQPPGSGGPRPGVGSPAGRFRITTPRPASPRWQPGTG